MHLSTFTRRAAGVLAATALGAGTLAFTAPSAGAVVPTGPSEASGSGSGYLAQAYGSYVYTADRTLSSGPTAYTGLACTSEGGHHSANNTAATDVPGVAHVGATETAVKSVDQGGTNASVADSRTAGASLLDGLVKVGALTSHSKAIKGSDGTYSAQQGSKVASLSIAGHQVDLSTRPNTRIALSLPVVGDIGYIEVNTQEHRMVRDEYRVATTALHVAILDDAKVSLRNAKLSPDGGSLQLQKGNQLSLLGGTHVRLGVTRAHLEPPAIGYLTGEGYGSQVSLLGGIVTSGKTAVAALPCGGGASNNRIAGLNLPELATVGTVTTHAEGTVTDTALTGQVTNETAGVNLLGGLIQAEAIKAVASASGPAGGPVSLSDKGSKIVGLKINGKSIDVDVRPNTTIKVGDLAEVTLHKVQHNSSQISVTMIEVQLLKNVANAKAGSTIRVAHASAGVNAS